MRSDQQKYNRMSEEATEIVCKHLRLTADALVELDRKGRTRTLPLREIREIRLHMAGTEFDVDHIVVVTPRSGRAMHLVDQEGNIAKERAAGRTTWAEFTAALLRRTAAAGGGTTFVAGPDASAKRVAGSV